MTGFRRSPARRERHICTTLAVVPANLSPEYKAAEAGLRGTRGPRERLEWLREMLGTIARHKATERLQADIKARVWARSGVDRQTVGHEHHVPDGDVVQMHA